VQRRIVLAQNVTVTIAHVVNNERIRIFILTVKILIEAKNGGWFKHQPLLFESYGKWTVDLHTHWKKKHLNRNSYLKNVLIKRVDQ